MLGQSLERDTAVSAERVAGRQLPAVGAGELRTDGNLQGLLEQANVEAVTEISDLIAAQRAYEMNAKVITSADQMLSATSNMIR